MRAADGRCRGETFRVDGGRVGGLSPRYTTPLQQRCHRRRKKNQGYIAKRGAFRDSKKSVGTKRTAADGAHRGSKQGFLMVIGILFSSPEIRAIVIESTPGIIAKVYFSDFHARVEAALVGTEEAGILPHAVLVAHERIKVTSAMAGLL